MGLPVTYFQVKQETNSLRLPCHHCLNLMLATWQESIAPQPSYDMKGKDY